MESQDLSPEEREIVQRFRGLTKAKQAATLASEEAFISFLQTIRMIWEIWREIAPYAKEIMNFIRSLYY
jgi:hypothetical protein